MATVLKGAPVVAALNEKMSQEVEHLKGRGVIPTLAIVRVGEREDDIAYERGAMKRCEKVGVEVRQVLLPGDCSEDSLITVLQNLNSDDQVHGVLLFRPLPKHMNDDRIRNALSPEKDLDGITDLSLAGVFAGTETGFPPCTAAACIELLEHYGIALQGKKAVVIGRSLVIGKPVAMMLLKKNATVTICHTRTIDMPAVCREAEVLIVAAGKAEIVGKDYFREGQIVIDVGINVDTEGKLCGDVNYEEAESIVAAITPVPGGVGTVTTAVLAMHVIKAAERVAR